MERGSLDGIRHQGENHLPCCLILPSIDFVLVELCSKLSPSVHVWLEPLKPVCRKLFVIYGNAFWADDACSATSRMEVDPADIPERAHFSAKNNTICRPARALQDTHASLRHSSACSPQRTWQCNMVISAPAQGSQSHPPKDPACMTSLGRRVGRKSGTSLKTRRPLESRLSGASRLTADSTTFSALPCLGLYFGSTCSTNTKMPLIRYLRRSDKVQK